MSQRTTSLRPAALTGLLLLAGCPPGDETLTGITGPASEGPQGPTTAAPSTSTPTTSASSPGEPGTSEPGSTGATSTTGPTPIATSTGPDPSGATSTGPATEALTSGDPSSDTSDATSTSASGTDDTGESSSEALESGTTMPPSEYEISLHVTGLVADEAVFELNGDEQLPVAGDGELVFTTTLPAGAAYAVALAVAPTHYQCDLQGAVGVMPMSDVVVASVCKPKPSATLMIAEVGFGYSSNDSYWLELSNVSAQPQSLADVVVRAPAYALDANGGFLADKGVQEFALPALALPAGARLLVRGAIAGETAAGPGQAQISLPGAVVPHWQNAYGAIELRKGGSSIDYVAWGAIPPSKQAAMAPLHPSAWPSYPAELPAAPVQAIEARGRSLARKYTLVDSNTASDLAVLAFSTPAGPNDTHGCVTDAEQDGLPDCAEAPGTTYAGVDLYSYGARPETRDIFVEIDMMNPKGGDGVTLDPGMVPQKAALDEIVEAFKANDIAVHFDVGDLFDASPGIDPAQHDLGGGQQIPFSQRICFDPEPNCAWMVDVKAKYFTLPRLKSFHHVTFANEGFNKTAQGQGERPGNDLYVSFGGKGFKTSTQKDLYVLINNQSQTLMHELGHNLGLSHGGFATYRGDALADEANWKPNYLSIMNYLYGRGLATVGLNEGDRYYYEHENENPACVAKGVDQCTMTHPVCGEPAQFKLDFSHGKGQPIDTAAVLETKGLYQPGSGSVDFDCNGVISAQSYPSTLHAAVDNMAVPLTLLRDHDDWGTLDLFFNHRYGGFNSSSGSGGDPLVYSPAERDIQPRAPVDPFPPELLRWLRTR